MDRHSLEIDFEIPNVSCQPHFVDRKATLGTSLDERVFLGWMVKYVKNSGQVDDTIQLENEARHPLSLANSKETWLKALHQDAEADPRLLAAIKGGMLDIEI